MMLLDMDDFEDINQKEGNIFADAVPAGGGGCSAAGDG